MALRTMCKQYGILTSSPSPSSLICWRVGSSLISLLSFSLMVAVLRPSLMWGHSGLLWPVLLHSKHVILLWLADRSIFWSASCVGRLVFVKLCGVGDGMFSSGWPDGAGFSGIGHCVTLFFVTIVGWLVAVWIVGSLKASCGVLWGLLKVFLP